MATLKVIGLWAAGAALAFFVGCGDQGGGSGTVAPTQSQKIEAQSADSAGAAIEQATEFSTDALVESGAPGSTSSKSGATVSMIAATTINYQASVTVIVDLDAPGGSGTDAHPNATGRFQVTGTGTVVGDSMNGQATYGVDVLWLTDGVFTDPACGAQGTVNAGSHINYTLVVQWAKVDDMNWSIQATYDVAGSATGTVVTHLGRIWDVSGTVTVHASASFTRTAGTYGFTFGISGLKSIVLTSGAEVHTVTFTMQALDRVFVDVDGATFGPYTLAQVWWFFHLDCRG